MQGKDLVQRKLISEMGEMRDRLEMRKVRDYRGKELEKIKRMGDHRPISFAPPQGFVYFCHQYIKRGKFHISLFLGSPESQKNRVRWLCSPGTVGWRTWL